MSQYLLRESSAVATSARVDLASPISFSGATSWEIRFTIEVNGLEWILLANLFTSGDNIVFFTGTNTMQLRRTSGGLITFTLPVAYNAGGAQDYVLRTTGAGLQLLQNGVICTSTVNTNEAMWDIRSLFTLGNANRHGDLYSLEIDINGSPAHNYDPSASNGTGTTLFDIQGNNDGTLINFTVPDCWVLIPSAGITVTGTTPNYSYSAVAASVSLTGEILVTGQTPNYSYTAIGATVDLTGEIIVTGATPSYAYNSINGVVTLTPAASIVVTGQTASYSYAPISGVIDLTPEIQITGATASYSYTAQGASIILAGTIDITGATASYAYTPVNAFVSLNALEPVVNFAGTIKQAAFAGFLRSAQFSGTIKQSSFSGTRKAAQFSGVRK